MLWSLIEEAAVIAAACMATFRPLFRKRRTPAPADEESRGRSGRPAQPFDTEIRWDPGLTIGASEAQCTDFSVDLPIQIPSGRSSLDIHLTNRSDSTAPLDTFLDKKSGMVEKASVVSADRIGPDDKEKDDFDLDSLPDLKKERTNETDCSGD